MAGSSGKRKRMWIHPFNYQLRLALGWASDAGRGWQDTQAPPPPRSQEGHGAQGCHWSSPRRVRKAPEEEGQLGVGE